MVADASTLRLLTLLLVVQECPFCLGRLGFRFRDLDCIGLWLSSPRCTWSRQDLLSLCSHGTLMIGPRGHSSSMASSTVASTSSGEGFPSSMLNPKHIHSVTASRKDDCLESLPGHLQADQLVHVCHAERVRATPVSSLLRSHAVLWQAKSRFCTTDVSTRILSTA